MGENTDFHGKNLHTYFFCFFELALTVPLNFIHKEGTFYDL